MATIVNGKIETVIGKDGHVEVFYKDEFIRQSSWQEKVKRMIMEL